MEKAKWAALLGSVLCAVMIVALLVPGCSSPAPAPTPTAVPKTATTPAAPAIPQYRVIAGTVETGASSYVLCAMMANLVAEKSGGNIRISVIPTTGGPDSFQRLRNKEIDMTNSSGGSYIYEAKLSVGAFAGFPSLPVNHLFPHMNTVFHTVMNADSPVEKWSDLAGKTVQIGTPGSGGAMNFQAWLELAGLKDKVKTVSLAFGAGLDALKDSKIDMAGMQTGPPNSLIMEFATMHPMKMLDFTQAMIDEYNKTRWGGYQIYYLGTLLKSTYPGMVRDAKLATGVNGFTVRPDFPEDAAYWITKLVWENRDELAGMNAAYKVLTPEGVKGLSLDLAPLHPGALKYYKEAGVI